MKTERRHDLETNDLARHVAGWIEHCKPYASQIFGALIVVFGLLILVTLWGDAPDTQDEAAWEAYAEGLTADSRGLFGLQKVSVDENYAGTDMQEWAQITWADGQVAIGSQQMFWDREGFNERLDKAKVIYESLIDTSKSEDIRNRARFGLGRTFELRNEPDEAREQYAAVTGSFERIAQNRLERLDKPETEEFLAWLAEADLPERKSSSASGTKPAFEADLPSSGFDATSLDDILGISTDSEDSDADDSKAEDKTEQPVFEVDPIFLDDGTDSDSTDSDTTDTDPAETESEAESPAESDSAEAAAEAESESSEP